MLGCYNENLPRLQGCATVQSVNCEPSVNARLLQREPSKVASLCDGAVYYGELTHQWLVGEELDGQPEEDFHQVGGG